MIWDIVQYILGAMIGVYFFEKFLMYRALTKYLEKLVDE